MTHLSPEELVAALDGPLAAATADHFRHCEVCRSALGVLTATLDRVKTDSDVPEPSPLFWEHLSARIRSATTETPAVAAGSWWQSIARPSALLGAVAALALVIALGRAWPTSERVRPDAVRVAGAASAVVSDGDDASWNAVAEMASTLSSDDVRLIVGSAPEAPAVNDLTPKEREAFVKLLGVELGGLQ